MLRGAAKSDGQNSFLGQDVNLEFTDDFSLPSPIFIYRLREHGEQMGKDLAFGTNTLTLL